MRIGRCVAVLALAVLLALLGSRAVRAQTGQSFTLQPGGKATITFEAFCLDFGQSFPQAIQPPNAVADDRVRAGLAYISSNGLAADQATALDAQYAVWQLRGATNSPAGGDRARAIISAASTPPPAPQGSSLIDAAKSGQVRVTVSSWQALGDKVQIGALTDNFYGRGALTVENISQQALTLYMPVGTLFPPSTQGAQTMVGYATDVQVSNPQPQQLPITAAGDAAAPALLLAGALALLAAGLGLRRNWGRR